MSTSTTIDAHPAPTGTWFRDDHASGPLPPLQWGRWAEPMERGFARSMERFGLPAAGLELLQHRGWVYNRFAPLTDPAAVADRVATRLALSPRAEARAATRWLDVDLPGWSARRHALRLDAEQRSDDSLADALVAVGDGGAELVEQRFADIAIGGLFGRWVAVAERALGLDETGAVAHIGGAPSAATTVLRAVRDGADDADGCRSALGARHGDVLLGVDVLAPTVAERVDLLATLALADDTDRSDPAPLPHLDPEVAAVLADAQLAVRWRESTHDEISSWLGTLRTLALEAGRRLTARGVLVDPELALYLTVDDLAAALGGEIAGLGARAEAHRAAHERAQADPPPPLLGPAPDGPPAGGPELPPAVADALAAIAWIGMRMGAPPGPPQVDAEGVTGAPAAGGTVTGRVRVIHQLDELGLLEPGEILVCATTSPGWDLAFAIAGAVVCDRGGVVSHAALLAREVGVPAVVGTKVGTLVLQTGQTVVVDGTAGTVRLV